MTAIEAINYFDQISSMPNKKLLKSLGGGWHLFL